MSAFAAAAWTFGVTLLLAIFLQVAVSIREAAQFDLVTGAFAQLIAYWLGLFAILRIYAPDASIRRFAGIRWTAPAIFPLALLLGAVVWFPTELIYTYTLERYPLEGPNYVKNAFDAATPLKRVVLGILIACVMPIIEESFFRGALFQPVRRFAAQSSLLSPFSSRESSEDGDEPRPPPPPTKEGSVSAGWSAVIVTSVLFTLVHMNWQTYLPLIILAVMLGALRLQSGSIVPCVLVHVGYNGISLGLMLGAPNLETIPLAWALAGAAASIVCFGAILMLCRSETAAAAREDELSS
jgi:membrane protease YdiL (CAAX protease family)